MSVAYNWAFAAALVACGLIMGIYARPLVIWNNKHKNKIRHSDAQLEADDGLRTVRTAGITAIAVGLLLLILALVRS